LQVDAVTRKADEQKREADLKLTEFAQLLDIRAQRIKVILLFYPVVCIFKHSVKTMLYYKNEAVNYLTVAKEAGQWTLSSWVSVLVVARPPLCFSVCHNYSIFSEPSEPHCYLEGVP